MRRAFSVVVHVLAIASVTCALSPQFPAVFSADVDCECAEVWCGGLPLVKKVYQDTKSSLWSHAVSVSHLQEVLITVPTSTADPSTPEATQLTRFSWVSDTESQGCEYSIFSGNKLPKFFGYPTSVLEKREVVQNIECEKWSNNGSRPYHPYWAVWYPINTKPIYSVVLKAQYIGPDSPPHSFPVPGFTLTYNFANFSTASIPLELFTPPEQWLTKCINSDGGIQKANLPDRQEGYVCVSPGKNNNFSLALFTKPQHDVTVQLKPCVPNDSCIDGARCKDCVQFSSTTLTFGPSNWSVFQTVKVMYLKDGDSQFAISSPNYYLNNTFDIQFSTCACASGKCSNNCQQYCGGI